LRNAGLVEYTRGTGVSKITTEGMELLKEKLIVIDVNFLMRYPLFVEYRNSTRKKKRINMN